MLVAFEAGSLVRAFALFILYPLVCLVNKEVSIKIMVMVCFFGIKKESCRVGSAVLPKFFLEDVGLEGFELMKRGRKTVGVSNMPRPMVESFLKDYLDFDYVVGRELKVFCGYFVGLMEDNVNNINAHQYLTNMLDDDQKLSSNLIGIKSSNKSIYHHWFSHCKEVYVMGNGDKARWGPVPKDRYTKPLIFHDGRLAFTPTPLSMLTMLMWFPFALQLTIIRSVIALSLPFNAAIPILAFSGMHLRLENPNYSFQSAHSPRKPKGLLYVCNHRTLLDPLFISFGLKKQFAAVTYSLSRMSEILAPIRTVRLTRNRDQDAKMMEKLLNQGDLVICPEGTTCREPYLLRFSPLFTELSDDIVPVALDTNVSMFYGTTASGLKCLDPFFFLMNPCPFYTIRFLEKVHGSTDKVAADKKSRFDVANYVQSELGNALGFECTSLTRKDKYLILAGNEGFVSQVCKG